MNLSLSDLNLISESLRQTALISLRKMEAANIEHHPHIAKVSKQNYDKAVSLMGRIMVEIERETQNIPKPNHED